MSVRDVARLLNIRPDVMRRFNRVMSDDTKAQIGFVIVALFLLSAVFAPYFAPFDPYTQAFPVMDPPTFDHLLGTDTFGRDMLSRIIYGARISLGVAFIAVSLGAVVGIPMGLLAGYYGGWVDDTLMRIADVAWAFPWLLVAIMLLAIFGQSVINVIIAIAFGWVDDFARVARGEVLSIREEEYILAAKSVGESDTRLIFSEIFPNLIAPIIVQFTIYTARAMISEATLSFLGIGVSPTTPTWGSLLRQGRDFMTQAWWISFFPGLAIMITVLGLNLFGDALRDAFDVKEDI